ncbi:MAG: FeoB-associated Cys-rich membrane protein [Nitrospinae bacterium]|nr:FeoB-associated Cys-rich membrane protein [Nitrospinota bacterium]
MGWFDFALMAAILGGAVWYLFRHFTHGGDSCPGCPSAGTCKDAKNPRRGP